MGTWKKMAEAFGRARTLNPNKNPMKGRGLEDGTVELTQKADSPLDYARFSEARFDCDVDDAFKAGVRAGQDIDAPTRMPGVAREDRAAMRESLEDDLTDRRLEQNASDEWDKAFARRKQGVRDWYGKDYPQDMAEEGAEAFEKQLWEYVDQLRAKGVPAQDILNRLKGNN